LRQIFFFRKQRFKTINSAAPLRIRFQTTEDFVNNELPTLLSVGVYHFERLVSKYVIQILILNSERSKECILFKMMIFFRYIFRVEGVVQLQNLVVLKLDGNGTFFEAFFLQF